MTMKAVKGIYDEKKFIALGTLPKKKYHVIITFLDEIVRDDEIRKVTAQTAGFSFWEDEREDLYPEYLQSK